MGGRRVTRHAALLVGAVVAVAGLPATSSAAPGDRTITGTIELDWGPSAPIAGGDVTVLAKACPDNDTAPACFNDTSSGYVTADLTSAAGDATSVYEFSLAADSTVAYRVRGIAFVDLEPGPDGNTHTPFVSSAPAFVPVGTGAVDLTPTPFAYDTRYVRLEGTVSRDTAATYLGVGACPAGNPFFGGGCTGLRVARADGVGAYGLNLWPGDWRAAGFIVDGSTPVLGVTNLLALAAPSTAAEAVLDLDFDANLGYSNAAVEAGAPNPTGGAVGDGNGDGTPDVQQPDVTSLVTDDGDYITIDTGPGPLTGPTVGAAVAQPFAALLTTPPATALTGGVTSFTVGVIPVSSTVAVDLIFHTAPAPGTEFWKYIDGAWAAYAHVSQVSASPYTLRVSLTDGGAGDYDNAANGYITDPFAFAPQHVLGPLGATLGKRSATFSWTLSLGSAPAAAFPSGGSLIVACTRGTYDLTESITGSAGAFSARLTLAKKDQCTATVAIPSNTSTGTAASSSTTVALK